MDVGFAGTPAFAAEILEALLHAGFSVALVLTQPDRPQSRGLKLRPSPVKELAQRSGLTIHQPPTLRAESAQADLLATPIDVLVVAAYGLILPQRFLDWPQHGCINIHASLLPRWRGAAPIQRALLAGDTETGVTLMQMDAGLDTGGMLESRRVAIDARENAGTLGRKLAAMGACAIVECLRSIEAGSTNTATPQPLEGITYAAKIEKSEAAIDWCSDVTTIDRQIRAFNPAPGAYTELEEQLVKVWSAQESPHPRSRYAPGTILETTDAGMVVSCGEGSLQITEVQPAGGRRMSAAAFAAGRRIVPGARFSRCRKRRD